MSRGEPTLGRRLIRTNLMLLGGIVVMCAASLYGVSGLRERVNHAVDEYEELRIIDAAMLDATAARVRLDVPVTDWSGASEAMDRCRTILGEFQAHQDSGDDDTEASHQGVERSLMANALSAVSTADGHLSAQADAPDDARAAIDEVLEWLGKLKEATDPELARAAAARQASVTVASIAGVAVGLFGVALLTSWLGYRGVMHPLRRLQDGVHRVARGDFREQIEPSGDRELAEFGRDFNRMATELDTLYRVMEDKVDRKSRELVRSERLASVGFLAACVAHEINNPLGIITGYAELAAGWNDGDGEPDKVALAEALESIRTEAFRCRDITEQLLSMARRSDEQHRLLRPDAIVQDVVQLVRALPAASDRRITVETVEGDHLVEASEPELKQVLLNLVVNALAATDSGVGLVRLVTRGSGDWIEIAVIDNGCGLDAESRKNVFEPFWSNRRGTTRGVGLGLAVSHVIVEQHGGGLEVTSCGPGRGATFTIRLPRVTESAALKMVDHG